MGRPSKLTPDQIATVRRRWEGCERHGFEWLRAEALAAFGTAPSRPAFQQMADKQGWTKGGPASRPIPPDPAIAVIGPKVTPPAQRKVTGPREKPTRPVDEVQGGRKAPEDDLVEPEVADEVVGPASSENNDLPELTPNEEVFAALVAKGRTKTAAYRAAYPRSNAWKPETVHSKAAKLAAIGRVSARIGELMQRAAEANEAHLGEVLRQYIVRLRADPRELTEVRVSPCRYCWGQGHRWQFTDGELARKVAEHADRAARAEEEGRKAPRPFDEQGGGGYNAGAEPNADCPACAGAGMPRVILHDSRTYSEAALALFEGVKETKEGIEVKLAKRDDALTAIARFVGFYEGEAPGGDAAKAFDTAALDAMYDRAMLEWKQGKDQALGRMDRLRAAGVKVEDEAPGG